MMPSKGNYGAEVIQTLLDNMTTDEFKGNLLVILAGYEDKIEELFTTVNMGLRSRLDKCRVHFPSWTAQQATDALLNEIEREDKRITPEATARLLQYFQELETFPDWGSAREVYEMVKPKLYAARAHRLSRSASPVKRKKASIGVAPTEELPPYEEADVVAACDEQVRRRSAALASNTEKNGFRLMKNSRILDKAGNSVDPLSLQGNIVGLYFSAHWCGPCRAFTPALKKKYEEVRAAGHPFEIIFISSDHEQDQAMSYFEHMPWTMLAYDCEDIKRTMRDRYEVEGIPTLVLLDKKGDLLTTDGRSRVLSTPFEEWDPNDDGIAFDDGERVTLKVEKQHFKFHEEEPEDEDDVGGGDSDDGFMESLEAACAELGYSPDEMEEFLTTRNYPEELVALLCEKTGKKAADVRRMIAPQSGKLLERVKMILKQMEQEKTKEEELKQEKLRKIGKCPMNFEWIKIEGGYRCAGGTHYCDDQEIDAYCID